MKPVLAWLQENWAYIGDTTNLTILAGTFLDMLPPIAASIAILYWSIRIYESDTVQQLLFKWKQYREDQRRKD